MDPVHPMHADYQREDERRRGFTSSTEPIVQYFRFQHLPAALQEVSKPFCDLAAFVLTLPRNAERTVALRKLLEAKDCAVRASMTK